MIGQAQIGPAQLARLLRLPEPTPEQAAVISAPLGPLAVIAGAVRRAVLLQHGEDPALPRALARVVGLDDVPPPIADEAREALAGLPATGRG